MKQDYSFYLSMSILMILIGMNMIISLLSYHYLQKSRIIYTISSFGVRFQIYFTTLQKYKVREIIYIKILRNNKTPLFPFHFKQEMWSSVFQNHLIASILWKCFWALWDIDLWDSKRFRFVNQLFSDDTFYLNFLPFCKNVV